MSAVRCSDASRAAGEALAGTASTTRIWLLVEVPGGWSRDVGSSDALPPAARAAVSAWLDRTDGARLLFIRRPARVAERALVFVVVAEPPSVRRIELASLADLADVDLERGGDPSAEQLVLVCGHGSRDQCCALRGTAVYGALAPGLSDEQVWISSHQGGHRFAANVLVLPGGLQLGRVEPDEAARVVSEALSGTIDLDRYRGCARYEPAVQAADVAVRRASGLTGVADLALVDSTGARVRFVDRGDDEHVAFVEEVEGPLLPASCGADAEPQPTFSVRLVPAGTTSGAGTRSP